MRIALIGYGKMGQMLEKIAEERGHQITHRISIDNPQDLALVQPATTDVAIEFTEPAAAVNNLLHCLRHRVPVVCGTTGWLARRAEVEAVRQAQQGAFFYASNYSLGVNLFFRLNQVLADWMAAHPQFDVQLEETHHTQKKDAPSGTAITLAEAILARLPGKTEWTLASEGQRPRPDQLSIEAYRIEHVPGTHAVQYHSPEDIIEIKHEARGRRGFALGAVMAAEWLPGKVGSFGMADLLGF
ncbi:MAG: 4-hydroxy-tetrahydrodipicolinate reductase [Bernardetiaceae bacterium]|jgi:4-hydroxy-tetrahydrodipicolinate reductase|nr:4-hydroxy-tetrahydrodipicolinate reductase [Bernardetiaceae bacterium]